MIRRFAPLLILVLIGLSPACGPYVVAPDTAPIVGSVDAIGITVADMDRSVAFYRSVLGFELLNDVRLADAAWDRLYGIEDAQRRVAVMRLGEERIELVQWLSPRGRAIPADSRSNDRWFQH